MEGLVQEPTLQGKHIRVTLSLWRVVSVLLPASLSPRRVLSTFVVSTLLFFSSAAFVQAQDDTDSFITTWRVPAGTQNDRTITFPGIGHYTINWGDGNTERVTGYRTHIYASAGSYDITVSGDLERFNLDRGEDREKLIDIKQWGSAEWTSMQNAFRGAKNMRMSATDTPDLSRVTSLWSMFDRASVFNGDISRWDVSNVTDMRLMFNLASAFNQDISNWNVSAVTNMMYAFADAAMFNQDIGNWDVSKVTDMSGMFFGASAFNGNIGNWDVSSVTTMRNIFGGRIFNQNLGNWYIVATSTTDYDATNNLAVVTFAKQPSYALRSHNPTYSLVAGEGSDNNDLFIFGEGVNNNILSVKNPANALPGTYRVRVGAASSSSFAPLYGTNNEKAIVVSIVTPTTDTRLSALEISEGRLTPGFGHDTTAYNVNVANSVETMTVTPTVNSNGATVMVQSALVDSGGTSAAIPLNVGVNIIPIVVTAHDRVATQTHTITVTRAYSSDEFVTTWRVPTGSDAARTIVFPGEGSYTINWGDGNTETATSPTTNTYSSSGDYDIVVSGAITRFNLNNGGDKEKLIDIKQWGTAKWTSMENAFRGANRIGEITAIDAPDLLEVTSLRRMFNHATIFNSDISNWEVRNVENMDMMFANARAFNQDISGWNVRAVTSMQTMFQPNGDFDQNLGTWYIVDTPAETYDGVDNLEVVSIATQNDFLTGQMPRYDLADGAGDTDNGLFRIDTTRGRPPRITTIAVRDIADTPPGTYSVRVSASHPGNGNNFFGTDDNERALSIVVPNAAADARLDALSISEGSLNSAFDSDTTAYTVNVDHSVTDMTVTPTATIHTATVMVKSFPVARGRASAAISLDVGAQNIPIVVTATDRSTTQPYTLTVIRAFGTDEFVTTWRVPEGDEAARTVTFPGEGSYQIYWGDDSVSQSANGSIDHVYASPGDYDIVVSNDITRFNLNNGEDEEKLIDVKQWGTARWTSMENAFREAIQLGEITATDAPDLSRVSNMAFMFYNARRFNGDIDGWDVSNVTNMRAMFAGASAFNQNISNWNVSKVENMSAMFARSTNFNQNIGSWTVSAVTNMSNMFGAASAFNQNIGDWDVSKVEHMNSMFARSTNFNQDIGRWTVSAVTNMSYMFDGASAFNQNISDWDVGNVTNMNAMFRDSNRFDQGISEWDVSDVTNMRQMFFNAIAFNQDIGGWQVGRVEDMEEMFYGATLFNQSLGAWYAVPSSLNENYNGDSDKNLLTISAQNAILEGQGPIYSLATGAAAEGTSNGLFSISGNTLSVRDASATPSGEYMVSVAIDNVEFGRNNVSEFMVEVRVRPAVDTRLSALDISEGNLSPVFNGDINSYIVSVGNTVRNINVTPTVSIDGATVRVQSAVVGSGDASENIPLIEGQNTIPIVVTATDGTTIRTYIITVTRVFSLNHFITTWKVGTDRAARILFPGEGNYQINWGDGVIQTVTGPTVHDYANPGTYDIAVTNGITRFNLNGGDDRDKLIDIKQWGTARWTSMETAFKGASKLREITATDAPILSGVTNMAFMFDYANNFVTNIGGWEVSTVTDMEGMFFRATAFNQDISGWDVSNVTNMESMFHSAELFNQNIGRWNVGNVTNMSSMFNDASAFNQDISNWNVRNVLFMTSMFDGADAFAQNLGKWYIVTTPTGIYNSETELGVLIISAQNRELVAQNLTYTLTADTNTNNNLFEISGNTLSVKNPAITPTGNYRVRIGVRSTFIFGGNNENHEKEIVFDVMLAPPGSDPRLSALDISVGSLAPVFHRNTHAYIASVAEDVDSVTVTPTTMADGATVTVQSETVGSGAAGSAISLVNGENTIPIVVTSASGIYSQTYTLTVIRAYNPDAFITTWRVPEGNAAARTITLPTTNTIFVDWGDGKGSRITTAEHTYDTAGDYDITVFYGITHFNLNNGEDKEKLIDVKQWGNTRWTSMENAFHGATNLRTISATDAPDLSRVSSMQSMFNTAINFNGNISGWDVSSVMNMSYLFFDARAFNQDIGGWDVSNVTNMSNLFSSARAFNQDIGGWDVSAVTDMSNMFDGASVFNQNISNWDVSQVANMNAMFRDSNRFDQDISEWDVSAVTNMSNMFLYTPSFNQNLGRWYIVDTQTTTYDGENNFEVAILSAQNAVLRGHGPGYALATGEAAAGTDNNLFEINGDRIRVRDATAVPRGVYNIRVVLEPNSQLFGTNNERMFSVGVYTRATDARLRDLILSSGSLIPAFDSNVFSYTVELFNDVNVIRVTPWLHVENQDAIITVQGVRASGGFSGSDNGLTSQAITLDVGTNTINVVSSAGGFMQTYVLTVTRNNYSANDFVTNWYVTNDNVITFPGEGSYQINWGDGIIEPATGPITHTYVNAGNYDVVVSNGITRFKTSQIIEESIELLEIKQWGTAEWTSMDSAFEQAALAQLTATDAPDLSRVSSTEDMFRNTSLIDGDIGHWDVSAVTDMEGMFAQTARFNGNIVNWDVSNATNLSRMFAFSLAFNQDISGWDVRAATDMTDMFDSARNFDQNLGAWYIVDTPTETFDAEGNLHVASIATQNSFLTAQRPEYTLVDGDGDTHNNLFSIASGAQTITVSDTTIAQGTYNVRVSASRSDNGLFGTENEKMLSIVVPDIAISSTRLSALSVSAGERTFSLTPSFSSEITSYTLGVDNSVERVTVTATPNSPTSTVTIQSTAFNGGVTTTLAPNVPIPLALGQNTISVIVTSATNDDVTERYNIDITRADHLDTFITTWRVPAEDQTITFPGVGSYEIDWGDGSSSESATGSIDHTYANSGDYDIRVSNAITHFNLNNSGDKEKLIDIKQWGTAEWTSMENAFYGASSMQMSATDAPNLSGLTLLSGMFRGASVFNGDISGWEVDNVTNMDSMFRDAQAFNQNIGGWNVSRVTNMHRMFFMAGSFNQNINDWDVISVENMGSMFRAATRFNQPLSDWDVSSVQIMNDMFFRARDFNQDIGAWDVSNVTSMTNMFHHAAMFNQDIRRWDVSRVTNMLGMFSHATRFNQDISGWDVSTATIMAGMFDGASAFVQNLGPWYIVENPTGVYVSDDNFEILTLSAQNQWLNLDIRRPVYALSTDSLATNTRNSLFRISGNSLFVNDPIATPAGTYRVSVSATSASGATENIFGTDNHKIFDVEFTLASTEARLRTLGISEGSLAPVFNPETTDYTVRVSGNVTSMTVTPTAQVDGARIMVGSDVVVGGQASPAIRLGLGLNIIPVVVTATNGVDTRTYTIRATRPTANSGDFITTWRVESGSSGQTIRFPGYGGYTIDWGDGSAVETATGSINHTYATPGDYDVVVSNTITRFNLNNSGDKEKLINVRQWGTAQWTSMEAAFFGANNMRMNATDTPDLSGVSSMKSMFNGASLFNGDISQWDVSGVTNMESMFLGATLFNQDIRGWTVNKVLEMNFMFSGASAFNQDISGWNVGGVFGMEAMFRGAASFNQDIGDWNVNNVRTMREMFSDASNFNQDIGDWNVSMVRNMDEMFFRASAFNQDINRWDVSGVTEMERMFDSASAFVQNLGRWYIGTNTLQAYDGGINRAVARLRAQNGELIGHNPRYDFANGVGDDDNDIFLLDNDGDLIVSDSATLRDGGNFSVRVAANRSSGSPLFGTNNQRILSVIVPSFSLVDARLSALSISPGSLTPVFNSETLSYTASVDNAVERVTVTPTATAVNATVRVNNALVTRGSASAPIPLVVGANAIPIVVTSADSRTVQTYTITVIRTYGTDEFVTTWRVPAGDENARTITFPGSGDYRIDWGDGSTVETATGSINHTYATPGDYDVVVSNTITRFKLEYGEDKEKLIDVKQWGSAEWTSMANAFHGAENLRTITATDAPDLSRVSSMANMFDYAFNFNGSIGHWDVENVTTMQYMFFGAQKFNQPLNDWDVSNVTLMVSMFHFATSFNQPLNDWDVSAVTNMDTMFRLSNFNGDISDWNVSKVTRMFEMFQNATAFNQDISRWKVGNVKNMSNMFFGASAFNQNINSWDVSSVTTMEEMFRGANTFDGNIGDWDVSNVENMAHMFSGASAFNQNIGGWEVGNVENMRSMFSGASVFNQNISDWEVGGVVNMHSMFTNASAFNQDIGGWDVRDVGDDPRIMVSMFNGANSFRQNLGRWYIVESPTNTYDGDQNLGILTFATQNSILTIAHNPIYELADGDGDSGNDLFVIDDKTLSTASANTPVGTHSIRVSATASASSIAFFGSDNAVMLSVVVPGFAPDLPTDFTATAGNPNYNTVDLTWSAPTNTGGRDISAYELLYSTDPQFGSGSMINTYTPALGADATSATVTGLTPNTTYYFRLTATNGIGMGEHVATSLATAMRAPDMPTSLTLDVGDPAYSSLVVTWDVPGFDGGSTITGYQLEYSTDSGFTGTIDTYEPALTPADRMATVLGLEAGTTYYFRLRASNAIGDSEYATANQATGAAVVPNAPTGLTVMLGDPAYSILVVTWVAPARDGGSTITGYQLEYSTDSGFGSSMPYTPALAATATTATVPDLDAGTLYYFRLRARNAEGLGSAATAQETTNIPLAANAGEADSVNEGDSYTLNGGDSTVPTGTTATYTWTQTGVPAVSLSATNVANPSFTAPNLLTNTPLTFSLVVNDGNADSVADTVVITVNADNDAPTAVVGIDRDANEGNTVTLDGSGSSDPEGQPLNYAWTQTEGTDVSLSSTTVASPTFTVPNLSANETLIFSLIVDDGEIASAAAMVDIRVSATNDAPTANAGEDQTVDGGTTVMLTGMASDPDSMNATVIWTQLGANQDIPLTRVSTSTVSFTAPPTLAVDTTYQFRFTATFDGFPQQTATDDVTVVVRAGFRFAEVVPMDITCIVAVNCMPPELPAATSGMAPYTYSLDAELENGLRLSNGSVTTLRILYTGGTGDLLSISEQTRTYIVTDANNLRIEAPIDLTVVGPTFPPGAAPDDQTFIKGEPVDITFDEEGVADRPAPYRYRLSVADQLTPNSQVDLADQSELQDDDNTYDDLPDGLSFNPQTRVLSGAVADAVAVTTDKPIPFYYVVVDNENGKATLSFDVTIENGVPSEPTSLTVVQGDFAHSSLVVTWGAPLLTGGSPITGYQLEYSTDSGFATVTTYTPPLGAGATTATVTGLTANTLYYFRLRARNAAGLGSVATAQETTNIPLAANAGGDGSVEEGMTYTLDGTASTFPTGTTATYTWTHSASSLSTIATVTLIGGNTATPSFTAPDLLSDGVLTFSLEISDGTTTDTAMVEISVNATNALPTADAGTAQNVNEGETVTLSGSGSDPEGQIITYAWSQINVASGANVSLSATNVASPTFTAPDLVTTGTLTFSLVVNDGIDDSVADTVVITVNAVNDAPIARAGADQIVNSEAEVTLNGAGSSDPEGQPITYVWTQTGGTNVSLSSTTAERPIFTAPKLLADGTLTFSLVVNDGNSASTADTVEITVTESPNNPPIADAGDSKSVTEGGTVTLDGSGSSDPDNESLDYLWTDVSGGSSRAAMGDLIGESPTFVAPIVSTETVMRFRLTVTDARGLSSTDYVTIRVGVDPLPDAPTGLTAVRNTEAPNMAVDVSWDAPADTGSGILRYIWQYDTDSSFSSAAENTGNVLSSSLTGLTAGATYYVRVRAESRGATGGVGDWSSTASTVLTIPPGAPMSLTLARNAAKPDQTMDVSWVAPTETGGGIDTYELQHSRNVDFPATSSTVTATYDGNTLSTSMNGLSPSTLYHFRVRARSVRGTGAWSVVAVRATTESPYTRVDAGRDRAEKPSTATETVTVTLTGNVRDTDVDSDNILVYAWSATPSVSLTGADTSTASFTSPTLPAGTNELIYTFTLQVTGGDVTPVSDSVRIAVRNTTVAEIINPLLLPNFAQAFSTQSTNVIASRVRLAIERNARPLVRRLRLGGQDFAARHPSESKGESLPELAPYFGVSRVSEESLPGLGDPDMRGDDGSSAIMKSITNNTLYKMFSAHGKSLVEGDIDMKTMLGDSSFSMPLRKTEIPTLNVKEGRRLQPDSSSMSAALWGSGEYRAMEGKGSASDYEGNLFSFYTGTDAVVPTANGTFLGGVAVSVNEGDFKYSNEFGNGDYDLTMTSVHPYIGHNLGHTGNPSMIQTWLTAALGEGEVTISPDDGSAPDVSDLTMRSIAAGGSSKFWQTQTFDMLAKMQIARTSIELESDVIGIPVEEYKTHQIRVGLELNAPNQWSNGSQALTGLEFGYRYDGGDGDAGGGIAVSARTQLNTPTGLAVGGNIHTLLGRDNYKEWSISGLVRVHPGKDGQGLSLQLAPGIGQAQNEVNTMLQAQTLSAFRDSVSNSNSDSSEKYTPHLTAELGVGMASRNGHGKFTPYSSMAITNSENRYQLGVRWQPTYSSGLLGSGIKGSRSFHLDFSSEHIQPDDVAAHNAYMMRGELRF